MENEMKSKTRVKHPDRVSISPEALMRLGSWIGELEATTKGIKITKNDLVNFVILNHSEQLSEKETDKIKDKYFDEVRFAEWATKQLKAAKAQGRHLTLSQVLGGAQCPNIPPKEPPRRSELPTNLPKEKERS